MEQKFTTRDNHDGGMDITVKPDSIYVRLIDACGDSMILNMKGQKMQDFLTFVGGAQAKAKAEKKLALQAEFEKLCSFVESHGETKHKNPASGNYTFRYAELAFRAFLAGKGENYVEVEQW